MAEDVRIRSRSAKPVGRPRWNGWRAGKAIAPYIFLVPFGVLFVAFMAGPLVYAAWLSMFRNSLVGGTRFVWFSNYARAIADPSFWEGTVHMLVFGAMLIPLLVLFALTIALILDSDAVRFKSMFRLGIFLPYAIPAVISTLLWGYLYGRSYGPIAQIAQHLNLPSPDFLSESTTIPALVNISIWQFTGYNFVILYGALQSVSRDLEDAAAIDGATGLQYARFIKIPLIAPSIMIVVVFAVIGSLQLFNEPYILRTIAPDVINAHYTPNIYAYSLAFVNQQTNYSAAISFMLGGVVAIVSYGVLLLGRSSLRKAS